MTDEQRKVPIGNLRSLKFLWQARGRDLDQLDDWNDPNLEREYPALIKAWRDYKAAREILNLVVDALPEDDEDA